MEVLYIMVTAVFYPTFVDIVLDGEAQGENTRIYSSLEQCENALLERLNAGGYVEKGVFEDNLYYYRKEEQTSQKFATTCKMIKGIRN